jgi:hypothetical protein
MRLCQERKDFFDALGAQNPVVRIFDAVVLSVYAAQARWKDLEEVESQMILMAGESDVSRICGLSRVAYSLSMQDRLNEAEEKELLKLEMLRNM